MFTGHSERRGRLVLSTPNDRYGWPRPPQGSPQETFWHDPPRTELYLGSSLLANWANDNPTHTRLRLGHLLGLAGRPGITTRIVRDRQPPQVHYIEDARAAA